MKIGIICPYSVSVHGGVQMQVLGLARSLRALGHDALVLAPSDGPPPEVGIIVVGSSVATPANGSVAPIAPGPAAQLRTLRALRDEAFDVVHLHEPLAPGPTLTTLTVHPTPLLGTFHAAGVSAAYRYLRPAVRRLAARLDHRCVVSADAEALAARYLGGAYTRLWNGIDVEAHEAAELWPTDGPTVFFIGRHEPRKGLDVLLAALARLPADVRVWVGGDGPDREALQARYGSDSRIEWLGRIDDAEKLRRLRGADVLCAPAVRGESFGIVLLEGMAAGAAVVASDLDGYRNVATHEVDALLA
ncbi:MAG: glycosyltransferase family 4 protein, partial [Acidimicrobiia bacterium]|nr:glycosyltransferase family 4 protein [Acidimicrobiia bacterium]